MLDLVLVIGYIVSYLLAALLLFLSYFMFPWGEFADASGVFREYTKLTDQDTRRSLFSPTGYETCIRTDDPNAVIGYNGICVNRMIMLGNVFASTFDGIKRYLKFFALFLVALPIILGFIVAEQIKNGNESFLFISNTSISLSDEEQSGQVGIWISLAYFWVMLSTNSFFFVHAFLNRESVQKLYKWFPIQYAHKVYHLSALLGFLVLSVSTMILISSDSEEYNDIVRASIVAPWLFAFRYFYRGFSAIFDMWGIGSLPGSRTFWFLFDKAIVLLLFLWLTRENSTAQLITIVVLVATNIVPLLLWLLKFRSARVPVMDEANQRLALQADYSIAKDAKRAATVFLEYPLYYRASTGGAKQYFWNYMRPWNMPVATFVSTPSTEENLYATMMSYYAVQDLSFFESTLGDFPAPLFQCLLPLCLLGLPIHGFNACKGDQFKQIIKWKDVEIKGVISPNVGRAVGLSQLFQGKTFDKSIVIIDTPGVEVSGFLLNQIYQPGRLEQFDIKEFHFVFKVETVRDLVLIAKFTSTLFNDQEAATVPNIVIVYTGGISSTYVKKSVKDAVVMVKDDFFDWIVFEHRLTLSNLLLDKLVGSDESSALVTCIGSSHMVGQIRPKVKAFKRSNVVFEDFVYEPSPYLLPVQKTSSTLLMSEVVPGMVIQEAA